jgi:hypothetical protein
VGTSRYSEDRIRRWLPGMGTRRDSATGGWICHDCGSLVRDRSVHDEWHGVQPPQATDEPFQDNATIDRSLEVAISILEVRTSLATRLVG